MPTKKVTAKKVTKPASRRTELEWNPDSGGTGIPAPKEVVEAPPEPAAPGESHRGLSPRLRYLMRRLGR